MSLLYIISARFVKTENFDWRLLQCPIKWSREILSGLIFVAIKPGQPSLLYFGYLSTVSILKFAFPSFILCQFSWKIKSVISSPKISFPVAFTLSRHIKLFKALKTELNLNHFTGFKQVQKDKTRKQNYNYLKINGCIWF